MNNDILSVQWTRPESSRESYLKTVDTAILQFVAGNKFIMAIETREMTIELYQKLLNRIFHQVYFSSASFALAASMATNVSNTIRSYLIKHAEEEKDHWGWILNDLKSTNFKGPDPRSGFPHHTAQAYLSYGMHLALSNPLGRLVMAQVLEGISGKFGGATAGKALSELGLKREQAQFFLAHGELDQGHSAEIFDVISSHNITNQQWAELEHVAKTTSQLYKNIYNSIFE